MYCHDKSYYKSSKIPKIRNFAFSQFHRCWQAQKVTSGGNRPTFFLKTLSVLLGMPTPKFSDISKAVNDLFNDDFGTHRSQ